MRLQRNGDGFCIDAGYLGGLLAVPVDRVQALMRANAIRCVCERGEGEHAGRYRLTFIHGRRRVRLDLDGRSEEHTSELQSLMRISYAVFFLKKKNNSDRKRSSWHHTK